MNTEHCDDHNSAVETAKPAETPDRESAYVTFNQAEAKWAAQVGHRLHPFYYRRKMRESFMLLRDSTTIIACLELANSVQRAIIMSDDAVVTLHHDGELRQLKEYNIKAEFKRVRDNVNSARDHLAKIRAILEECESVVHELNAHVDVLSDSYTELEKRFAEDKK